MADTPAVNAAQSAHAIAACIVCRNEADKLADCLASVAWADEIIVLDLDSDDDSAEVARRAGARVLQHPPVPIVELVRNVVAAAATAPWILVLDPDERLEPGAEPHLRRAAAAATCDAVIIPRTNYDFGYPPTHAGQRYEPQLRMYRRAAVDWPVTPNRLPMVPSERVQRLPHEDSCVIRHERSRSITEVLDRSIRYAPAQAAAMRTEGIEFSAAAMGRALWREVDRKLLQPRAWRDGLPGLLRAGVLVSFKFHVWVELWQLCGGHRTPADDRSAGRLALVFAPVRWGSTLARRTRGALRRAER